MNRAKAFSRPHKAQATNELRHCQSLNEDRESHHGERSDNDLLSFGKSVRQSKRKDQSERSTQAAPHKDMLIASVNGQA